MIIANVVGAWPKIGSARGSCIAGRREKKLRKKM